MNKISAFMDGEASRMETRQIMSRLEMNDKDREIWETVHLIGDVMRRDLTLDCDFNARIKACMQNEPTVLAPRLALRKSTQFALSAAASLAGVAIVLTLAFTENPLSPFGSPTQVATAPVVIAKSEKPQQPPPQVVAAPQPVPAVNQSRVNEYLMAHQEYSPSTALQGLAPYIRTVSAMQDANGK